MPAEFEPHGGKEIIVQGADAEALRLSPPGEAKQRLALPGYQAVTAATRERLRQGWKALTVETPLMVFRMGHAEAPAIRTGRPSWESFVRA